MPDPENFEQELSFSDPETSISQAPINQVPTSQLISTSPSEICQHPGCKELIDPSNKKTDNDTGKPLCANHGKNCDECDEVHDVDNMHQVPSQFDRNRKPFYYCKDCYNNNYIKCPNCGLIVDKDKYLPPSSSNINYLKKGGCTKCCFNCESCNKLVDNDYVYNADEDKFCEKCFSENFTMCSSCGDPFEANGEYYCPSCYKEKYTNCRECDQEIEKNESYEYNNDDYCKSCFEKLGPEEYHELTNLNAFSYTKKDKFLNILNKILPITIKDLKSKYPNLANGLADLIAFSKGKPITHEMIEEYRGTLKPEDFPVKYSIWEGVQRSINTLKDNPINKPQLVMNILASSQMITQLQSNKALLDLFNKINKLSEESGHPSTFNQIGWARLEIDPNNEFVLVDEIQSDHSGATYRLKNIKSDEVQQIRDTLKSKYNLDDAGLEQVLSEYANIVKDFPNIANQAIVRFARQNKINKIFWHTYESGMKLKENEPPKSLYDKTPKENFFLPSQNKPFGLEGEFFEKEAKRVKSLYKLARKLYFKYVLSNKSQLG